MTSKQQALILGLVLAGSCVLFLSIAYFVWGPFTWDTDRRPTNAEKPVPVELESPWSTDLTAVPTQDAPLSPIHVAVEIKGDQTKLSESARVYVIVRPTGSRMPLGVERYAPSELPKLVTFTPKPGIGGDVEVVARLSLSGRVEPSAGDIEDQSSPMKFEAGIQHVALSLDLSTNKLSTPTPVAVEAITIRVSIGDNIIVDPAMRVFIFAREPGSPMPVAVKRLRVADLPTQIELSDADTMMPTRKLSDLRHVEVVARASSSGSATPQKGDWEGRSTGVVPGQEEVVEVAIATAWQPR